MSSVKVLRGRPGSVKALLLQAWTTSIPQSPPRTLYVVDDQVVLENHAQKIRVLERPAFAPAMWNNEDVIRLAHNNGCPAHVRHRERRPRTATRELGYDRSLIAPCVRKRRASLDAIALRWTLGPMRALSWKGLVYSI